MHRDKRTKLIFLIGIAIVLSACNAAQVTPAGDDTQADEHDDEHAVNVADEDEHADTHQEDEHMHEPEDHMEGMHSDIPEEAAATENPIEATDVSVVAGAAFFATSCAVCHGEVGHGDGPTAAALEPAPADLHAAHVQANSDGALFYIISHGVSDTAMPPWDNVLTEDERWHIVNFMRTFDVE